MLVKLISLLATYMAGRTAHAHHKGEGGFFSDITFGAMKRVAVLLSLYVVCLTVFIFGATIITADLIVSTQKLGAIAMTELSWVGLGVIVVAGIAAAAVSALDFQGEKLSWKKTQKQAQHSVNAVGDAITLLVMDFIDERRAKRDRTEAEKRAYAASTRGSRYSDTMTSQMN